MENNNLHFQLLLEYHYFYFEIHLSYFEAYSFYCFDQRELSLCFSNQLLNLMLVTKLYQRFVLDQDC